LKLSELCRYSDVEVLCGEDVSLETLEIREVCIDSRKADKESIFAPILGSKENGGDYVGDAYARGCRVFLSETNALPKSDTVVIKTKNIRKTVAELSFKINGEAFKKVKLIGITGTKGKTSIAFAIAKILSAEGIRAFSIGTLGLCDGDGCVIEKTKNTTPEPTELSRLIKRCADMGAEVIALEVSSQAIADFRVYGLKFFAVVFSSLAADHIGKSEHESFTEYAMTKRSFFVDYKADYRIFNADDRYTPYISFGTEKCIKCGFAERSDYHITDFSFSHLKSTFKLSGVSVLSSMPAMYDAVNISLALVASSLVSGIGISSLAASVPSVKIPGRFERYNVKGRTVIIDYAHNGLSVTSVLSLVRKLYSGKIISVFGSVGERSKGRRRELAEAAEAGSDYSVITSDNPGFESAESICMEIMHYFKNKSSCEICVDREAAIFRAYELSAPGDVIMLLGKGHEVEMNINGVRLPFSERNIVKKLESLR